MRIRKKKWAQPELDACDFFISDPRIMRGKWKELFVDSDSPLELEVGCGKGTFAAHKAIQNPGVNYLAVDIKSDMLGVARRNITSLFEQSGRKVNNVALTAFNVDKISEIVSPADGIVCMYINFCNPWPRKKHHKRRLTHPTKLEQYKEFLPQGGRIYFKTDNDELFEDSLEYFAQCGFELERLERDLHNSNITDNIVTEHEKMFSDEGIPIKYLVAIRK